MNKQLLLLLVGFTLLLSCSTEKVSNPIDYVDLMIGTDATGNMFPGPSAPFGMVQLSPDTYNDGCCSGYHYTHSTILGFSHTHLSGTGCADFGDILLMPTVGRVQTLAGSEAHPESGYRSRFSHDREVATPGYYSVMLDDYNVKVELTATSRVGFHQYTFPASDSSHILLDLEHDISGGGDVPLDDCFIRVVSPTEVEGFRHSRGWANDQYVYFVAQLSEPCIENLLFLNDKKVENATEIKGNSVKAVMSYKTLANQKVKVKVAISAVSLAGARANLEAELNHWDFDKAVAQARAVWAAELSKIKVEGGSRDQRTIFYTALYHALLTPNLFSDVDGKFRGMDHKVYSGEGFDYYHVFSLWDTYRALHPLINILDPQRNANFIKTMVKHYEQTGLLPVWELAGCENNCMIGYHAVPVIADAYLKGNRDFDVEKAFEAMLASGRQNIEGIAPYREFHYIPRELSTNSVSKVLEYAYDDWCIAQMAKGMGNDAEYREYIKRSQFYRNQFDSISGLMRPRHLDGRFLADFNPFKISLLDQGDFTEANSWHYSFYVPHDIPCLIRLSGGDERFIAKLDTFFTVKVHGQNTESDFEGKFGQYAHGNEPSHHMPYLYSYAGAAYKTQEIVHKTMTELYTTKPNGLCGNDDCGQLSAWYIFSAMGFYPVCPGQDMYVVGSPIFDKVTISLPDGKEFTIHAKNVSDKNIYINSATINGQDYPYSYIKHSDILKGGEITFNMDSKPNKQWGSKPEHRPFAVPIGEEDILKPLGVERLFVPIISPDVKMFSGELRVEIKCISENTDIHYTLDGSEPTQKSPKYISPITVSKTSFIKARAFKQGFEPSGISTAEYYKTLIEYGNAYPTVSYLAPQSGKDYLGEAADGKYAPSYSAGGDRGLVDGRVGSPDFTDGRWQGFFGKDMEIEVDLGEARPINRLTSGYLQSVSVWILYPEWVEYSFSPDGKNFKPVGRVAHRIDRETAIDGVKYYSLRTSGAKARYIKVKAKNIGICPPWHHAAGNKAWIFVDEVIVE